MSRHGGVLVRLGGTSRTERHSDPMRGPPEFAMGMTTREATRVVTGGVDTHLDVHVAAAPTSSAGSLAPSHLTPRLRARRRCSPGSLASVTSSSSASKAPVRMAHGYPAASRAKGFGSSKSTGPIDSAVDVVESPTPKTPSLRPVPRWLARRTVSRRRRTETSRPFGLCGSRASARKARTQALNQM